MTMMTMMMTMTMMTMMTIDHTDDDDDDPSFSPQPWRKCCPLQRLQKASLRSLDHKGCRSPDDNHDHNRGSLMTNVKMMMVMMIIMVKIIIIHNLTNLI